jgi:hypothetical protein
MSKTKEKKNQTNGQGFENGENESMSQNDALE